MPEELDLKVAALRAELINHVLPYYIARVRFIKLNGDERTMRCTLIPSLIPPAARLADRVSEFTSVMTPRHDSLRVFDIDKQEWRSFRLDSVITLILEDV